MGCEIVAEPWPEGWVGGEGISIAMMAVAGALVWLDLDLLFVHWIWTC